MIKLIISADYGGKRYKFLKWVINLKHAMLTVNEYKKGYENVKYKIYGKRWSKNDYVMCVDEHIFCMDV